jgi:ornithine carbamoyltransferase
MGKMQVQKLNKEKQVTAASKNYRHFIDIADLEQSEINKILNTASSLKDYANKGIQEKLLDGKQLAMVFEKASTRTRVSFEVGISQMGGNAIYLSGEASQIGRGEPVQDTAKVLSRYVDLIMIRTFKHDTLKNLAEFADVPVINGLTDFSHPCQILADILTIEEHKGDISKLQISWSGDFNNVCRSWAQAGDKLGLNLNIACPPGYEYSVEFTENVKLFDNAKEAVKNSDVVITDTWFSMGDRDLEGKAEALKPYQVNKELFSEAKDDAIFLHCLPAHRGEEVTEDVIDSKNSVIYDEAENRLHVQKAIMLWCLGQI